MLGVQRRRPAGRWHRHGSHAPVLVKAAAGSTSALSGVQAVALGQGHTCALLVNGTVKCWGYNFYGELGDGTTTERHTPVTVKAAAGSTSPLSGVIAVAVGDSHSCALLVGGTVKCWGANGAGGLGDGTTSGPPHARGGQGRRQRYERTRKRPSDRGGKLPHLCRARRWDRQVLGLQP